MNKQKGFSVIELMIAVIMVVGTFGWVWNIIKLVGMTFTPVTIELILRICGVVLPPLGAVMGFIP